MSILIKPIITEKLSTEGELFNRYGFYVDPKANKIQIKEAVESTYGVTVDKVRTQIYAAERKTRYTKTGIQHGKTNLLKKAIVQVAEGEVIDIYSNL